MTFNTSFNDGFYGDKQEPIAIIGAACRLPGEASSMNGLWDMLSSNRDARVKIPAERFNVDALYHPDQDRKGSLAVKHGFFINQDVSTFDAPFFKTTAKEAAGMDPMKRLLLEVSYEGFENAGIPIESLPNTQTGVYVGSMTNDYDMLAGRDHYDLPYAAASGLSNAMTANRISWFFGLRGPSINLDTACSASLTALHLAIQSLRLKETNMSLVTGVNLIFYPNFYHQLSSFHMLSPEGISHTFDERANGYARGEGVAAIVVKRLSDALRDGDTIRAVIRGSGANADGKTPSVTTPSSEAQAELIKNTYAAAGLSYADTTYFETHGTGTPLGDPIELKAIATTFGEQRTSEDPPLYIGSIKGNVGHTEGCSGLAGLLKSLLCLEKGKLVPTFGFKTLNPKLKLPEWKLALPLETMDWPTGGLRRISVNSFGFGGANSHVIMDDAYHYLKERGLVGKHSTLVPYDDFSESGISMESELLLSADSKKLFLFSAKEQGALQRLTASYVKSLQEDEVSAMCVNDLAHTLSNRRSFFDLRCCVVAGSISELSRLLEKGLTTVKRSVIHENIIYVFTGQGAQWPAMGKELLSKPIFRESLKQTQVFLDELKCSWDIIQELERTTDSQMDLPEFSQPICTAIQLGLTDLLRYWGIKPKATIGHSSGEIGAAYAAGLISHKDAITIAYCRGVCSGRVAQVILPRVGAMLAAGISENEAMIYLEKVPKDSVTVACINSPSSVTFSGDDDSIVELGRLISDDGKFARKLRVQTAYHSNFMNEVAKSYVESMGTITPIVNLENTTFMYSSVTGKQISGAELTAAYWVRNMCEQVRFSDALTSLLSLSEGISGRKQRPVIWSAILELGPSGALKGPITQTKLASDSKAGKEAPYFSLLSRGEDAVTTSLSVAGQLWSVGHILDFSKINEEDCKITLPKSLPDLPAYPWNHTKGFWHETKATNSIRFPAGPRTDLLGMPVDNQNLLEPMWRNFLRISENPWIEDHQITGTILYPAAGMLVMVIEAATQIAKQGIELSGITFKNVSFERGLVISSEHAVETSLSIIPHETLPSWYTFTVFTIPPGGSWTKHCSGTFSIEYKPDTSEVEDSSAEWAALTEEYAETKRDATTEIDCEALYSQLEKIGMEYGPSFKNMTAASIVSGKYLSHGTVKIPDTKSTMPAKFEFPHVIHPATMDAIFHLLLVAFCDGQPMDEAAVPFTLEYMFVAAVQPQGADENFVGFAKRTRQIGRETAGDMTISDSNWTEPKLIIRNFIMRQVTSDSSALILPTGADGDSTLRTAQIEWKEDIDFSKIAPLVGVQSLPTLRTWMSNLYHKKAESSILFICSDQPIEYRSLFRELESIGLRKWSATMSSEEAMMRVISQFEGDQLYIDMKVWDPAVDADLPFGTQTFDVIILVDSDIDISDSDMVSKLSKPLKMNGHLVTVGTHSTDLRLSISSIPEAMPSPTPQIVYLLMPEIVSESLLALKTQLSSALSSDSSQVCSVTVSSTNDLEGQYVICLLEAEDPFVYDWSGESYIYFKNLVSVAKHVLWITRGGIMQDYADVRFSVTTGLLRVIRTEYPQITLPHLDLSIEIDLTIPQTARLISDLWIASIQETTEEHEMEYAELNSTLFIPRVVDNVDCNRQLELGNGLGKPIQGSLDNERPLKAIPTSIGSQTEVIWEDDFDAKTPLESGQVEVEIEYISLNATDTEQANIGFGSEAVGIVSALASDVHNFTIGDRVVVLISDCCRTHIRQDSSRVHAVSGNLLPQEIVSLPRVFIAAQYALLEVARLTKGQTVLIHSAASSLGQAAVQIARLVGAEVFATVNSRDQREILVENYQICPDHVFDSKLLTFAPTILRATKNQGVDVVLNTHSGSIIPVSFSCLADFGYFIDLCSTTTLALPSSKHNATLSKIDFGKLQVAKPKLIEALFHKSIDMIANGSIGPVLPTNIMPISELNAAIAKVKSKDHYGKIVLAVENDASLSIIPASVPELKLDSDGTYIISGGLGALGLEIAELMFQHGAGHIVFLSRSGGGGHQENLNHFLDRGFKAEALKCDITISSKVEETVTSLENAGNHIRGLIQCAMVLEDAIFENMTYENWTRATSPKVQGTLNLHTHLPKTLDFFIMLSSIVCIIGNAGQANYAAGNTFEDAFSHYRHKQGLSGTAVNVGLVADSASFFEKANMDAYLLKYGQLSGLLTSKSELMEAMKVTMKGGTARGEGVGPQVILGMSDSIQRDRSEWMKDRKFDHRITDNLTTESTNEGKFDIKAALAQATTIHEAAKIVEDSLKEQVAVAMGATPEEIDQEKPLYDFGVDSLKAVEVRNRIFRDIQSQISVFEVLSPMPLARLSMVIAGRSELVSSKIAEQAAEELS